VSLRGGRVVLALALAVGTAAAGPADASELATRTPPSEHYTLHCSGCHRLDGRGVPGVAPSLRNLGSLLTRPGGREYLSRVPGVAQAPLTDSQLARLLNWVVAEWSDSPPRPPFSEAEVGALRREPLRDPQTARAALTR